MEKKIVNLEVLNLKRPKGKKYTYGELQEFLISCGFPKNGYIIPTARKLGMVKPVENNLWVIKPEPIFWQLVDTILTESRSKINENQKRRLRKNCPRTFDEIICPTWISNRIIVLSHGGSKEIVCLDIDLISVLTVEFNKNGIANKVAGNAIFVE